MFAGLGYRRGQRPGKAILRPGEVGGNMQSSNLGVNSCAHRYQVSPPKSFMCCFTPRQGSTQTEKKRTERKNFDGWSAFATLYARSRRKKKKASGAGGSPARVGKKRRTVAGREPFTKLNGERKDLRIRRRSITRLTGRTQQNGVSKRSPHVQKGGGDTQDHNSKIRLSAFPLERGAKSDGHDALRIKNTGGGERSKKTMGGGCRKTLAPRKIESWIPGSSEGGKVSDHSDLVA